MSSSWRDEAVAVPDAAVCFDRPLAPYTSLGLGGPAECLVEARSVRAVRETLRLAASRRVPLLVLGNGTNVLVRDGGVPGITLRLADHLVGIEVNGHSIRALAGTGLAQLCETAASHGLTGVEHLAGIPGTLGGALVMNAGAWEHSISKAVREVSVADRQGELQTLRGDELGFGYRQSALQDGERVVLEAVLELGAGDERAIRDRMLELAEMRCERQPVSAKSAGSTFERPPDDYAGRLIEAAGLKGHSIGGAQVSSKHANFLINAGNATAQDMLRLIRYVQEQVEQQSGVSLQAEVRIVGVDSPLGSADVG